MIVVLPYDFATPTYLEALALRQEVLRVPLGLDINDDPLHLEFDHHHLGAFDEQRLVGTCSLRQNQPGVYQMRQVAVSPTAQGRGTGRLLVAACERFVSQNHRSGARLFCHARDVAVPFYERCGWRVEGEVFTEVGIVHRTMVWPRSA